MSGRVTRETLYGQVIYPDELPHKRGKMAELCSFTIMCITAAVCLGNVIIKDGECISFLVTLILYMCAVIALKFIRRLQYFAEERNHVTSRYDSSHIKLFKKLFYFNLFSSIFILFCVFCCFCIFLLDYDIEYQIKRLSLWHFFGVIVISHQVDYIVDLDRNPIQDSVFLENMRRMNYGSGMAQNFFYGYLRLCLPHTGDQEKGILERIEDYISKQRLSDNTFPVKKLFVLIPSSSYIPNDLKDVSFGWMETAGSLEELVKFRAGVKDRVYKNTVYRIKDPDDSDDTGIYAVVEGATPCKTLYEVAQYSGVRKDFFVEHQKEIIFNFYETLREILREDRDCRDLCEFIYYVDTDEFGLNNVNIAKLIMQRINELQMKENFLKGVRDRNF